MKLILSSCLLATSLLAQDNSLYNEILKSYKSSLLVEPIKQTTNITNNIIKKKKVIQKKSIKKTTKKKLVEKKVIQKNKNKNVVYYTTKNTYQNLRISPSSNALILHVISKGTKVKLLDKIVKNNDLWFKIEYLNSKNKKVIGYLFRGSKN